MIVGVHKYQFTCSNARKYISFHPFLLTHVYIYFNRQIGTIPFFYIRDIKFSCGSFAFLVMAKQIDIRANFFVYFNRFNFNFLISNQLKLNIDIYIYISFKYFILTDRNKMTNFIRLNFLLKKKLSNLINRKILLSLYHIISI